MRAEQRIVIALSALISLALGLGFIAVSAGWDPAALLVRLADALIAGRLYSALLGLVLLGLGIWILTVSFSGIRQEENLVKDTEWGHLYISLRAIETLVRKATEQVRGTRETNVSLTTTADGLVVSLDLLVAPDTNVPEVAAEVQQRVGSYVRETVGVEIAAVHLRVRDIKGDRPVRTS
jgi:uncharacterized alkaline shock family protein YloU